MIYNENAIEIENICKTFRVKRIVPHNQRVFGASASKSTYKNNIVLDGITLNIKRGETVGIIGRNGSGKSTLLKIVSKILDPDTGSLKVNGKIASILELGMGFHQDLSGRENIYIKASMYGFSKREIDEKIEKIIEYSGLGEQIDDPLRTYSSGMSGRLAFAIMINVDAEILIIDEILSVGDASFSAKASQHFKRAAKSGKTILFVSHSISSITEMCSRTIWIENGKIREDGETKTVCDLYKREINESFEITKEFAEAGVVDAQYRLAHMYLDGDKVEANAAESCKWMGIAAENKNINAMVEYGDMLFEGIGTDMDVQTAITYYQKAADLGNDDAVTKIAALADNDDKQSLIDAFEQLANKGFPNNEFYLAELLLKTSTNSEERKMAFEWFVKAADKGHLEAKHRVALLYGRGIGVKKNVEQYIVRLEEVANLGHARAQLDLAELYSFGKAVSKNEKKAFFWYLKSAESGNLKAQYQTALRYRDGIGVDIDLEESKKWFKIFSNTSLIKFWTVIGNVLCGSKLDTKLTEEEAYKKTAESFDSQGMFKLGKFLEGKDIAVKWLQMAADRQNVRAQVLLGDMYSNGKGVDIDHAKAFEYYLKASMTGNPYASHKIALMYKSGTFLDRDMEAFERYLDYTSETRGIKSKK